MATLNISGIIPESLVDGPGIRFVIFAQGCIHDCPGCFNKELQSFKLNKEFKVPELMMMIKKYNSTGVTFSGGDPFAQVNGFALLAEKCKQHNISVWAYTGYTFEELLQSTENLSLLKLIDVLVDGRFHEHEKDLSLQFRGSKNQRLINVPQSLKTGSIIHYIP